MTRQIYCYIHRLITTSNTTSHYMFLGMDDSSPEVRNLLTALMDKAISADEQGLDRAGDREISMALFGKSPTREIDAFFLFTSTTIQYYTALHYTVLHCALYCLVLSE
jgi:hypothetical protein